MEDVDFVLENCCFNNPIEEGLRLMSGGSGKKGGASMAAGQSMAPGQSMAANAGLAGIQNHKGQNHKERCSLLYRNKITSSQFFSHKPTRFLTIFTFRKPVSRCDTTSFATEL